MLRRSGKQPSRLDLASYFASANAAAAAEEHAPPDEAGPTTKVNLPSLFLAASVVICLHISFASSEGHYSCVFFTVSFSVATPIIGRNRMKVLVIQ